MTALSIGNSYQYDANGNITCRVENSITYKQTYNAENRISNIMKMNGDCSTGTITESWSLAYDGDGTRTGQVYTNIGTGSTLTTMYFMGGAYETTDDTSTVTVKKYYAIAGMTVAMNDGNGMKYLLTDHLGSVVAMTDASGSVLSQQRYLPFGQVRTDVGNISQTDFGYTGQRALDNGLMDYHARFYDASLGRFVQPDTIIPNMADPQSWNKYSYVYNDPIDLTDPTGNFGHSRGRSGYLYKRLKIKINNLETKWRNDKAAADEKALQDAYYTAARAEAAAGEADLKFNVFARMDLDITPTPTPCGSIVSNSCATATAAQATTSAYQCKIGDISCMGPWTPAPTPTAIGHDAIVNVINNEDVPELLPGLPSKKIAPGFWVDPNEMWNDFLKTAPPFLGYPAVTQPLGETILKVIGSISIDPLPIFIIPTKLDLFNNGLT